MTNECDKLALHFKYCALIALMAFIALATERWSEKESFTTYLSNAATMTSLLLAVVAIFYSFISNDSLSRSLGSITTVSTEVQGARQQIVQFLDLTRSATEASSANTALVQTASQDLTTNLLSLRETLEAIASQNGTLRDFVSVLPTRLEQIESKVGDVAKALGEKPAQAVPTLTPSDISERAVSRFLARASMYQNLLTYACVLAASTKKPLVVAAFCKAVKLDSPSNFNGFLNCMSAIQLCNRKAVEGQDKTYQVTALHPELDKQTKNYFTNYLDEAYATEPAEKEDWLQRMRSVEALFA